MQHVRVSYPFCKNTKVKEVESDNLSDVAILISSFVTNKWRK